MINITDKKLCSGCGACQNICPKKAISMKEDVEGTRYPFVDVNNCINCGICDKVCPFVNTILKMEWIATPLSEARNDEYIRIIEKYKTPLFFAAQLKNKKELQEVSSGGAFWGLTQYLISKNGVVYGAIQKNVDKIIHIRAENIDEAKKLRRSKYFQSDTIGIYSKVKEDLLKGKTVLFSGVPCQIAGLYGFLGKEYENLYTCEVVCHGVPVNSVWRSYRKEKEQKLGKKIVDLVFRDKSKGWAVNQYKIIYDDRSVEYEPSVRNLFHRGYLEGFFYRPSCGKCPFSKLPRVADITLADFWKYKGKLNEICNMGVSLVSVNNEKGLWLLNNTSDYLEIERTNSQTALCSCRHLNNCPAENPKRNEFIGHLIKYGYHSAIEKFLFSTKNDDNNELPHLFQKLAMKFISCKNGISYKIREPIKSLLDKVTHKVFRYKQDDIDILNEYLETMLDSSCIYDFEFEKSLKALLYRSDSLFLSDNRYLRFLFKLRKMKRSSLSSLIKNARFFLTFRDACVLLAKKGVPVYFYNRVGLKKDGFAYSESAKNRMKNKLSFPLMYEHIDKYENDLKEIFGDKYSKEYVEKIGKIPQVIQIGDYYCHEDFKSNYVNVVDGKRITCFQPKNYRRTIHIYGRCGAFGYAVEDSETLPSQIQKELIENGVTDIKVVNHGLWGGDNELIDSNFFKDLMSFGKNDIVLFYRMHFDKRILAELEHLGLWYHEITDDWHKFPEAKNCFYDKPGHMNATGYKNAAILIVKDLIGHDFKNKTVVPILLNGFNNKYLTDFLKNTGNKEFNKELNRYIEDINRCYPNDKNCNSGGAIVMNCNPFTLGHRKLIEYASNKVGRLYIFVVQEDKSFFKFEDRFEMVKNGVADLKNVVVVPSGKFIISAFTFPEYFMKDYVKEKNFDVSSDIQIFCKYIAPAFNIKTRFAGEEPFDPVTLNYNDTMRKILPEYGMEFCEIPRFENENKEIINATKVRELLKQKEVERLKTYVPASTLEILLKKYMEL